MLICIFCLSDSHNENSVCNTVNTKWASNFDFHVQNLAESNFLLLFLTNHLVEALKSLGGGGGGEGEEGGQGLYLVHSIWFNSWLFVYQLISESAKSQSYQDMLKYLSFICVFCFVFLLKTFYLDFKAIKKIKQ